jgi:hypothetical protein
MCVLAAGLGGGAALLYLSKAGRWKRHGGLRSMRGLVGGPNLTKPCSLVWWAGLIRVGRGNRFHAKCLGLTDTEARGLTRFVCAPCQLRAPAVPMGLHGVLDPFALRSQRPCYCGQCLVGQEGVWLLCSGCQRESVCLAILVFPVALPGLAPGPSPSFGLPRLHPKCIGVDLEVQANATAGFLCSTCCSRPVGDLA